MPRKKAENPTQRLTIYLLGSEVASPADALSGDKRPIEIAVAADSGLEGAFYYEPRRPHPPSWLGYVRPILAAEPEGVISASSAGVLLLRVRARYFAVTFGFGRSLLDSENFEPNFGLRVALNRIDPDQIRSMDTRTFEDMVLTRRTQTSRSSQSPSFGVDVTRDILRSITGESRDSAFAKRLAGSDGLVMNAELAVGDLGKKCSQLLDAFDDEAYRENFGWIDHLRIVRDQSIQVALDGQLVAELRSGKPDSTHLAMPEPLDWQDIDAFRLAGTYRRDYEELDLPEYLDELGDSVGALTVELLKGRKVGVKFARAGGFEARWSIYNCLVSESRLDGQLYVLIEGRWFEVSDSLVEEVDGFCQSLPEPRSMLPPAQVDEKEPIYNLRVAQSNPTSFLRLDAKILRPAGATTGIEPCDLLSSNGEFVHVKRKSRSSTLSHLFAQGSVSADTFVNDAGFRFAMRRFIEDNVAGEQQDAWLALVPESLLFTERSRYSVAYAVVADSTKGGVYWLPFFSRLNLMQHGRFLQNLGVGVSVVRIGTETELDAIPA